MDYRNYIFNMIFMDHGEYEMEVESEIPCNIGEFLRDRYWGTNDENP